MSNSVRERVIEWLTGTETTYLIGAGCSHCAGKPLIGDLTKSIIAEVDADIRGEFLSLRGQTGRDATIEDLINYLSKYSELLRSLEKPTEKHTLTREWIDNALSVIKKQIVEKISDDWSPSNTHKRFLERIQNKSHVLISRDIFTTNYDTVIESSLDDLCIPYTDGFRGSRNGWYDESVYDETQTTQSYFRIYKLHGSINWVREIDEQVRRTVVNLRDDVAKAVVVYPSEQKYLLTQYGVYETLMKRFRDRLRQTGSNSCLVVLGYSFNDDHINEALVDAVNTLNSNLTIISFIGPDSDHIRQNKRLRALEQRCLHRFNAFVANDTFIGSAMNEEEAKSILERELWNFKNLVDFIAGASDE